MVKADQREPLEQLTLVSAFHTGSHRKIQTTMASLLEQEAVYLLKKLLA